MRFKSIAEFLDPKNGHRPTTAERKLIEATRAGRDCFLCDRKNPSLPTEATDKTRIRAPLLRLLITGGTAACGLHERGVTLIGGWINGTLDLAYCTARGQTGLDWCKFPEEPLLQQAIFQLIGFQDSAFDKGFFGQGMRVKGDLYFRRLVATGTVAVNGAKIGGQFTCEGARLDGGKDAEGGQIEALNAQGVEVGQSLFLRRLVATGKVDVNGAKIGGQLDCEGAKLHGGTDADGGQIEALNAQGVEVGHSLFLRRLAATGTVNLNGTKIGGQLDCEGSELDGGKDAEGGQILVLNAQGVEVGQSLFLLRLVATGTVAVNGAKIGGQFACEGARLDGGKDAKGGQIMALNAQALTVAQGFYFRDVVRVTGRIDLNSAKVGDLVDDLESWPRDGIK